MTDTPADGGVLLDNGLTRVHVDQAGLLASVRDLVADREVLAPGGKGNLLRLHTDFPNYWDAWDIDRHYRDRYADLTDLTDLDAVTILDDGPPVGSVRIERTFGSSRIVQTVRLRAGRRRVDIDTEVDWHEAEKLLKASFPLDLHADGPAPAPLVSVEGTAASIEAVKLADDRSGDVIVRLYESLGGRAATTLRAGFPLAAAEVVDLLERPLEDGGMTVSAAGGIPVELRPFQVLTVRLKRG